LYSGSTLSSAVYSLVWANDNIGVGEATTVSNTALTGSLAFTIGLIYGGTTVAYGNLKIKVSLTLTSGHTYAYYSPLFALVAPVRKYTINVGNFPVTAAGISTTTVTISGETYTATTAIPPQYGTISELFNGGMFRTTDSVFNVTTGLYRGDAAWAGGMITTTTTAGAAINGPWIQMQFYPTARMITEVGWGSAMTDTPKSWYVLGSNTGAASSWEYIGSESRGIPENGSVVVTTLVNYFSYNYYRVVITAICGSDGLQSTLLLNSTFYFKG
jgi:hypothetical protein